MGLMFNGCSLLTYLDLSMFDTTKVVAMRLMFCGCSSLTSLNLSNFDISKVTWIHQLFDGCVKLEYINIKKFNEIGIHDNKNDYEFMFRGIPQNAVICINENITGNKIFPQIKKINCYNIDCSDDWKTKQKKIINESINDCNCELNNCLSCPKLDLNKTLCSK
jgi:surface protein